MILANCYVKVVLSGGAEDAELPAKEIYSKPEDIRNLKEKEHEAYVGIGKKPHKVMTFPVPEMEEYLPGEVVKISEVNFLGDGWIYF